jgi:putative peptidoglycan lipid II flippase
MSKESSIRKRLGAAAILMTVSVLLSRILGYARDAIIAAKHGATAETDVYYASFTLPDLMSYMLAGGALYITFLPMFSDYIHKGDEKAGWDCFSVVATTMGSLVAFGIIVAWFLAPYAIPLLVPGFDEAQIERTVQLTRIVLPAQLFFYLGGMLGATVLARERFAEAALAPLVYNALIIAGGLALGPWFGIAGFSWGALVGAFVGPFGLMLYAARKRGLTYRPRWSMRDPDFQRFFLLSLPVMVGFSLVSVDEWISRYFASTMEEGSISWIQNARRLMLVPVSVLGQAAGQATLPFLARLHAENKDEEAASVLADSLRVVAFATLAASAWMMATSEAIIGLFYERGAFTAYDTVQSASALVMLSLGILAWSMQALVSRGFYALQDTWTPMLLASGVALVAVPLYWFLGREMGHRGLALATSIGMGLTAVITVIALQRRLKLPLRALGLSLGRSALVAIGAGALASYALSFLSTNGYLVRATVGSLVFGGSLALAATVLRVPEWQILLNRLLRRRR